MGIRVAWLFSKACMEGVNMISVCYRGRNWPGVGQLLVVGNGCENA